MTRAAQVAVIILAVVVVAAILYAIVGCAAFDVQGAPR